MAFDPTTATLADAAPEFDPSTATLADSGGPAAPNETDPTAGMSTTDKFLAGGVKGLVDYGRGVYQLGASIGHAAGMVSDEKMASIQQNVDDSRALDAPLMNTTAGKVGDFFGTAAPALLLPGAGIAGSAMEGAALGAAQPVGTGDSRWTNTYMGGLGGAAGAAAGKVLGGVLGGFGGAGDRQAAVDLLESEGVPVSVAQATQAKLAQSIERASAMTSDDPAEFAATQGAAFNRAVLQRIGVTDPKVMAATPEVLGPAKTAITDVMDDVASRTRPRVDNTLLNDLSLVEQSASRQLPTSDIGPITQNISDILENASQNNGYLDGKFVQKLNSNLGALSRNPSTAPIASDMQEAVHNAVARYAAPDDAAAFSQAQKQFRALKQIEPAIDPATGNISVPKLMTSLNSKGYGGRNQTLYGRGDQSLIDLARAAKQVIPEKIGNSFTPERALPALTALEVAASGEPVKAAIKAGSGVFGLNAAGSALRNQGILGTYLQNGIPGARAAAPIIRRVAPALGYGAAESQINADGAGNSTAVDDQPPINTAQWSNPNVQTPRATGGKVDHEALTNRLFTRWKQAQKDADATTEPLLKFPDSAITKALRIAQSHPLT
jgi:hypothetical protein